MHDWWRIRLGTLALVLVVSCGDKTQGDDTGPGGSGAAGVSGVPGDGGAGGGGTGGQAGASGPGIGGSLTGAGGGRGGAGGTTGTGATSGRAGTTGTGARGGVGGSAGTAGTGGLGGLGGTSITGPGGQGGTGGTSSFAGRGGAGGISGAGGRGGQGGTGGRGGTGGQGGTGGTAGAACTPSTCWTTTLQIDARDVVYSAARNELYVSIPDIGRAYPNTILVVDPTTGSIRSVIPIGSNPGALAISDDGSMLWVALEGAHALRRVALSATPPVVGPLIHLPKARPDKYFDATSLAVLAGEALSVVVVLSEGGDVDEVRVYDNGVPRATGVTGAQGSFVIAGPPGTAFGSDNTLRSFYVHTVSPSGITATPNPSALLGGTAGSLAYVAGRVFAGSGEAIDVSNLAAPTIAGRLPYQGMVARRDAASVMMLSYSSQRTDVRMFSNVTLSELGSVPLPVPSGGVYSHLVYAGGDALALIRRLSFYGPLMIVHHPALGAPRGGQGGIGGQGGTGGTGGQGGTGGTGGTGGAPDPCPGCSSATVQAYGRDLVHDRTRNLIYVAADAAAPVHPSTIVTVDATAAAVTSFVAVGNDPQSLALSGDDSALWVGLVGERRVRRVTPGASPVPGPAYALPPLLTTGEASVPTSIAVLPGTPSSIAVAVHGNGDSNPYGYSLGRGVFILDDGLPRANYIQPPEVTAEFLINGPPGYLLGVGDNNRLVVLRLGTVGATLETHGGLFGDYNLLPSLLYAGSAVYGNTGPVVDLTNPEAPRPAGRFVYGGTSCTLASRSATRVMMFCPGYAGSPNLSFFDNTSFTRTGSLTLPLAQPANPSVKFVYLGGDAVALVGTDAPLQIVRAPMIGAPP